MGENKAEQNSEIDFVLIWVDDSDIEWQKNKANYRNDNDSFNANNVRYRDWDILQYWFRAVEKYTPWVRKIHFVTCGHIPQWLKLDNPKLNFVKHSDYIDSRFLPTFSSHPIELNLHKIKGLAEQFVYFNDDMFINAKMKPDDFFKDGLPCDCAILNSIKMDLHGIPNIIVNDLCVITEYFNFSLQLKKHWRKWINYKYGKLLLRTLMLIPWRIYSGFYEPHLPTSFLKSTFQEIWNKESQLLNEVSSHKFRSKEDVNQWLIRYWQLASGEFIPRSPNIGKMYMVNDSLDKIICDIKNHTHKMICINDSDKLRDFEIAKKRLQFAYQETLPDKSSFEI